MGWGVGVKKQATATLISTLSFFLSITLLRRGGERGLAGRKAGRKSACSRANAVAAALTITVTQAKIDILI